MSTSNLDRLIVSFPQSDVDCRKLSDIRDHQCKSSSSQTPTAINIDSQEDETINLATGALKVQVPTSAGEHKVGNDEDNPKTPRSVEYRIPVMATCPPAPRKAERVLTTGKRRASCFPVVRVSADFMVYMDTMLALNEAVYVPDIVVGDLGAGDHVNRLKFMQPSAHELKLD